MDTLRQIKIAGIKYYLVDDIMRLKIPYTKGSVNSRRLILNKKLLYLCETEG